MTGFVLLQTSDDLELHAVKIRILFIDKYSLKGLKSILAYELTIMPNTVE